MTVQLPKARIARVRVSSLFGGQLDLMGLYRWLHETAERGDVSPDRMAEIERGIVESRHWMFTPFRDLTLVHAVQQPLDAPAPEVEAERSIGETHADLRGQMRLHAPSTAKVDLLAQWSEPRDDPARDEPDTVEARTHIMELPTALDGQPPRVDYPEAPDALRLEDDQLLVFNTRQAAYARRQMQSRLDDPGANFEATERRKFQDQVNLASKVTAHEFGDTKYRRVRYHASATSRFREYFALAITANPENLVRSSDEWTLDIPSSARPAAPHVLYALPTFAWQQATDGGGTVTSTRRGGAVRVYLDRPWWSSGDGELLAVVLGQGFPDRSDKLYSYSTFWGQDPTWGSPGLPLPHPPSFKNAVTSETHVQLSELPGATVEVVGFHVEWDGARKLWYCDINLDTGNAYAPFVRLALARFQPNSLSDVHISAVVLADFV